jgi:hypothetical protein
MKRYNSAKIGVYNPEKGEIRVMSGKEIVDLASTVGKLAEGLNTTTDMQMNGMKASRMCFEAQRDAINALTERVEKLERRDRASFSIGLRIRNFWLGLWKGVR